MKIKVALENGKVIDRFTLEDSMVLYKNRIYIPDSNDLKLTVTKQCYNAKIAGHFGRDKMLELLQRNYYWPNLEE